MGSPTTNRSVTPVVRQVAMALILVALVAVAGLTYVKWWPYYNRIIKVSATRTLGTSIFGSQGYFGSTTLDTAWAYTVKYFKAVWQAALLGIVLGGAVEAILPTSWVDRYLSGKGYRSTLLAGVASLPGMMCSCCATPVVVGLRKRNASTGAAIAFWMGNPALNPATLTVVFLVLGWKFGLLRLIFAAIAVFGVSYWIDRRFQDENRPAAAPAPAPVEMPEEPQEHWALRWVKASGRLAMWIIPEYLVAVVMTGLLGGFFFPAGIGTWSHSLIALVLIALAGTLFVIPTMAEIPIVQGLMAIGLPAGPATALLLTLPTISLPSLLMAGRSFKARTLATIGLAVAVVGIAGGLAAIGLF
jgi:uncharacterized protein